MASRQLKMPEDTHDQVETEPFEHFSQRKRPEAGRFLLQVDRQTKGSYQTAEAANSTGLKIKKDYPLLHVSIYDTVEYTTSTIAAVVPSK
jgi:hypothetical protein